MTSQYLIVKIQSLLSGSSDYTDERSLALEYRKKCAEARDRLEHCVALIRAGRDYAALQVAEAEPKLLESINDLSFKESAKWRAYCEAKSLPTAPDFDEALVALVQSLYSRGITQAHPLYRDYRRAMRRRDLGLALSIMLSIKRVNSFDAEAKREYERLLGRVLKQWVGDAVKALERGDDVALVENCRMLEPYVDELKEDANWERVSNKYSEINRESARKRCMEILDDLRISPEKSADKTEEISELEMLKDAENIELSAEDKELVEKCLKIASDAAIAEFAREDALTARGNLLAIADSKEKLRAKDLKLLYARAKSALSDDEKKLISGKISAKSRSEFAVFAIKSSVLLVCLAGICYVGYGLWTSYERTRAIDDGVAELSIIASVPDFNARGERLANFQKLNSEILEEPVIASRLEKIKNATLTESNLYSRAEKAVSGLEKINLKSADERDLERAKKDLANARDELTLLSEIARLPFSDRLAKFTGNLDDEIAQRREIIQREIRDELSEYERVSAEYENFGKSLKDADNEVNKIIKKLSQKIEKSGLFAAHKTDIAKYDAITSRIAELRSAVRDRDEARSQMNNASSIPSYFLALETLISGANIDAKISDNAKKIISMRDKIEVGQMSEFSDFDKIPESLELAKSENVYNGELLRDVWVYECGRKTIFTAGEIAERKQSWNTGAETLQEAREIYMGGKILKNIYRQTLISGKAPRGEILVNGKKTVETKLGDAAAEVAKDSSVLSSISTIANADVNALYKARLEFIAFKFMSEKGIAGGVALSKSAKQRLKKLEQCASDIADYSWIFEGISREKQLAVSLYSEPVPNFGEEANKTINTIKILRENPPEFAGFADADGNGILKDKKVEKFALWAVDASGNFRRFESGIEGESLSPFTPILREKISLKQAEMQASNK